MNKKVKVLFLGSLILNVLLVGLILGDLSYRFGRDRFWHPRMSQRLEQLPEPLRDHLYRAMKQVREKNYPLLDKLRQTRRETIRILETEPFDAMAYDQQISLMLDLRGQMARHMADVVKGLAKKLPMEQRAKLSDFLRSPPASPRGAEHRRPPPPE